MIFFPCVKQRDLSDCGPAALAAVARYYHKAVSPVQLRMLAGTDQYGTSMAGLIYAAGMIGLHAVGVQADTGKLSVLPLPAIAHVVLSGERHHFVAIYRAGRKYVWYMDPAEGVRKRLPVNEFGMWWTGKLLLIEHGVNNADWKHKPSSISRIWWLLKPYRYKLLLLLAGGMVLTIMNLMTSVYIQKLLDIVLPEGNLRLLHLMSIAMLVLLLFQVLMGMLRALIALRIGQSLDARLIAGYFRHIMFLPKTFFNSMQSGDILSRLGDAVKTRLFVQDVCVNLLLNAMILLFSVALMCTYSWRLTLLLLAFVPLFICLFWISSRVHRFWSRKIMEQAADMETILVETLQNMDTVRQFGMQQQMTGRMEEKYFRMLGSMEKAGRYGIYMGTVTDFFSRLLSLLLMWYGGYAVLHHAFTAGELMSFFTLSGYYSGSIQFFIGSAKTIREAVTASDRLFEIMDVETEPSPGTNLRLTPERMGDIRFSGIEFRYNPKREVLKGLDLTIKKGILTAIVGENGSGKSTLFALLLRIYNPSKGNISIDGIGLDNYSASGLRQKIGIVPQQPELFSGTILQNIVMQEENADMEKLVHLCMQLGIHEFINALPHGYLHPLKEKAVNLSGGQKQRLALARALYREPQILLLDEATANLDAVSEQFIFRFLRRLCASGVTVVIIAHKLSLVKEADEIHVIKDGKLYESGNHHTLLATHGFYADLWSRQDREC